MGGPIGTGRIPHEDVAAWIDLHGASGTQGNRPRCATTEKNLLWDEVLTEAEVEAYWSPVYCEFFRQAALRATK